MYTGLTGQEYESPASADALRIHHGQLHRKRSRFGNEPVEGGLFTGREPAVVRRQHGEEKNFTLDAACAPPMRPAWSPRLGGVYTGTGAGAFRLFTLVFWF